MSREWVTTCFGAALGLTLALSLRTEPSPTEALPGGLPPSAPLAREFERPEDDELATTSGPSAAASSLRALRDATRVRDALKSQVEDIRELKRWARVHEDGVEMPPTISNCMHTAAPMEGCPLATESPETLRYLLDCKMLVYDVPGHVFAPTETEDVPWRGLEISESEAEALRRTEEAFRTRLTALVDDAFVAATGEPRGSLPLPDAFREILHSSSGQEQAWGASQGYLVQLGELEEADLRDLPSVARLYAEMARAGDEYEKGLSSVLGDSTARDLREAGRGWSHRGVALGGNSENASCNQLDYPEGY